MKRLLCLLCVTCSFLHIGTVSAQVEEAIENDSIVEAQYPGGEKALKKFLKKGLQYPDIAKEIEAEGICFLEFTIGTDGNIKNIVAKDCKLTHYNEGLLRKYSKDKQEIIKKECVRQMAKEGFLIIKKMKSWKPATCNGKPVETRITYPIQYGIISFD